MKPLIFALALAGASLAAHATPICRWTDETGRAQVSDVVPDRYSAVATCTDSRQYELSPEQQREAATRAGAQRSAAPGTAGAQNTPPATGRAADALNPIVRKRPTQIITDATDCDTWMRAYAESDACFGPYRTTRGGIKPEAFDHCNEVPSPEPKCGPLRD